MDIPCLHNARQIFAQHLSPCIYVNICMSVILLMTVVTCLLYMWCMFVTVCLFVWMTWFICDSSFRQPNFTHMSLSHSPCVLLPTWNARYHTEPSSRPWSSHHHAARSLYRLHMIDHAGVGNTQPRHMVHVSCSSPGLHTINRTHTAAPASRR